MVIADVLRCKRQVVSGLEGVRELGCVGATVEGVRYATQLIIG